VYQGGKDTFKPNKGGFFDPGVRDAAGFLYDTVSDPLTYLTLGPWARIGEAIGKLPKVLRVPVRAAETVLSPTAPARATGNYLREQALKPLINMGEKRGKENVSKILYEEGASNFGKIGDTVKKISEKYKASRDALMEQAKAAGAKPDVMAAYKEVQDHANSLVKQGRITQEEANKILMDMLEPRVGNPNPDIFDMSQWKTDVGNDIKAKARNVDNVQPSSVKDQIYKAEEDALRAETERTAGRGVPGGEEKLKSDNARLGEMLTIQEKAADLQRKGAPLVMEPLDWLMLSGELPAQAAGYGGMGVGMLAARKAWQAAKNPGVQLPLGHYLKKFGTSRWSQIPTDIIVRRKMAQQNRPHFDTDLGFTKEPDDKKK
jgi:gas vesicle protein